MKRRRQNTERRQQTADRHPSTAASEPCDLPAGWTMARLGAVGAISGGGTPSTKVPEYWGGDIHWLVPSEATRQEGLSISATERKITEAGLANCAARLQPVGTVLMTSRATIGDVVINAVPMATNQGFINIICDDNLVFNQFLAYWIKRNKQTFIDRAHGVTFKEITKSNFKTIPIGLPPLPEQHAIADILRVVQNANDARRREITLERERKAALMQHLFTHGTRNESRKRTEIGEMPESWRAVKLGEVGSRTQYGISLRGNPTGTYPILRMNNLEDGRVDTTDLQYVELDTETLQIFRLNKGDILFNRTNSYDLVGKTSLFDLEGDFVFASYLVRVLADREQLSPAYLNSYLNWQVAQQRLKMLATRGVSQSNINASKLREFDIPLPSLPEQCGIAELLRACDVKIAALQREQAVLGELFRVMLEELMTGTLSATPLVE